MQTAFMERSNSMKGSEKRALDSTTTIDGDDGQPDRKRPALASVIVEALKVDSLQRLCSSLEPILRRVVSEEVERALAKMGPAKFVGRASPKQLAAPDGRNLQLHFRTKLSLPLFTGGKVEGEQGASIQIVLLDANTGQLITTGPESCAKLDIVVLEGDFNHEGDDVWSQEHFDSHVVKEREGKRPLLTGDIQVTLNEGVGTLGELSFTDNSSWIRSRQFRLGLKVAPGYCDGLRIREAKTEPFTVKDHRGELYKKHYPPASNDEVWRLEKIGKDGAFHKRLNKAGIVTVEDFLRFVVRDAQRLRNILGSGMSNKMWEALVDHAKTCVLSGKLYIYYPDGSQGVGVIFNSIYEFSGLIAADQYYSTDSLTDPQKVYADILIKKAYDNWMHVVEYDAKSLTSLKQNKSGDSPSTEAPISQNNINFYNHQLPLPSLADPAAQEQPSLDPGINTGGLIDALNMRYTTQPPTMNVNNSSVHHDATTVTPQHQFISAPSLNQPPQQPPLPSFQPVGSSNPTQYQGNKELQSEEEMLEHEDMRHLVRIFGTSSNSSNTPNPTNITEDGFPYSSSDPYAPSPAMNFNFNDDEGPSSGKAVVGWLKLKAALRWGVFVRKEADERRAQLIELDDT